MKTTADILWVYLTDMGAQAKIFNPATNEIRSIGPASIKGGCKIGLRRYIVRELGGGIYAETGDFAAPTLDMLQEVDDAYGHRNSWNYDFVNYDVEAAATPEDHARLEGVLAKAMERLPFEYQTIGLQRRFLMYFSDGDYNSQQKFVDLVPPPSTSPFRRDGTLKRQFVNNYTSMMRDAGAPKPKGLSGCRPLLYKGPAWAVRFQVDQQVVAFEHCIVYVTDEGEFICSDWCQRHDHTTYDQGINLQTGIYTFDGWVESSAITRAIKQGVFKPKSVTIKREAVRDLMKKHKVISVPTFDEAMVTAAKKVASVQPAADPNVLLRARVAKLLDQLATDAADAVLLDALVSDAELARTEHRMADLAGVPVLVPHTQFNAATRLALKGYVLPDGVTYRLTAGGSQHGCMAHYPKILCLSPAVVGAPTGTPLQHVHLYDHQFTLDAAHLRTTAAALLAAERAARVKASGVEAGPITADVMAEVLALTASITEEQLAMQEAEIVRQALKAGRELLAATGISTTLVDGAVATILPQDDDLVKITLSTSGWSYFVRPDPASVEAAYRCSTYATALDGMSEVSPGTPLEQAAEWYYEEYLPEQAAGAVPAVPVTFRVGESMWEALPLGTGQAALLTQRTTAGTEKLAEPVKIKRGNNGHPYLLTAAGWAAIANGDQRLAALAYFKQHAPKPVTAEAVASTDLTPAEAVAA